MRSKSSQMSGPWPPSSSTPLQKKLSAICKFKEKLCFASNVEISLAASDLRFPLISCAKSQDEHISSIESAKAQFLVQRLIA